MRRTMPPGKIEINNVTLRPLLSSHVINVLLEHQGGDVTVLYHQFSLALPSSVINTKCSAIFLRISLKLLHLISHVIPKTYSIIFVMFELGSLSEINHLS